MIKIDLFLKKKKAKNGLTMFIRKLTFEQKSMGLKIKL